MTSAASPRTSLSAGSMRLLLVLLFVIWSNSFTAIGYLLGLFAPMDLVLARFLPVALFCALYLLVSPARRRETIAILREAPLRLVGMGLTGVAGYNFFLYTGQNEIKPGAASLVTTLAPLFILILAVLFLRERVPPRRTLGIVIAFIGLYVVVRWGRVGLGRVTDVSHAELRYVLITALAPLCWSIYTIIGKNLLSRYSPIVVTYLTLVIGTLPFLAVADGDFFLTVRAFSWVHWMALGHLSVLCTIAGFLIWIAALSRLPASEVASYVYLNPPLAAIFGRLFYGEEITRLFVLGGAVVLVGLWLARGRRENNSPAQTARRGEAGDSR